ncbi:MAG: hypothetical protein KGY76_02300 [Candidatus Thermoplasmatota archaeon]|nr:hypothetical protein [Candidatus Thermoplasmatota archaeon]
MSRIDLEELKKAIEKELEKRDMEPHQAEDMAEKVMNLFGYDKAITDNLLSSEERDVFYKLEEFDILTTEEETTNLPSGKKWRIHYWVLNERKIRELLQEEKKEEKKEEDDIYKEIEDTVWERDKG